MPRCDREIRFCHCCDRRLEDSRGGTGLFLWVRGDQVEYEEPPLCFDCSQALSVSWLQRVYEMEDEG